MSGTGAFNVSAPSLPVTGTYTILLTLIAERPADMVTARTFRLSVTSP